MIPPGGQVNIDVIVQVNPAPTTGTSVTVDIGNPQEQISVPQTVIIPPVVTSQPLRDPLGRITGCVGEILPDYTGFSVALHEVNTADPTGTSLGKLLDLTPTEVPDIPNNNIKEGLAPNRENSNPFFLTNGEEGIYNFLLDVERGQLTAGKQYILRVSPPRGSNYQERRIRIDIGETVNNRVNYTATSLDGNPISATDGRTSISGTIEISDGEKIGLNLGVFDLNTSTCDEAAISIIKTGDRAAAEPGDTALYRLSIRNLSSTSITNLNITDQLPFGFTFRANSVRGQLNNQPVNIVVSQSGSTINFTAPELILPPGEILEIVYAVRLTPDALRGNGRNSAIVNGIRTDNGGSVKDGPAIHRIVIRPGIVSNCGTIIGRVFIDKNFDGEQQEGEPGVPNAVIFTDDGNRIVTDENGLFSVINALPGYRTAVLDLTSVPGYQIAPNRYFIERNSQSRLVHLQPGGLVRMNFAIAPLGEEGNR
ncbi:MAG TPA: DUF11 domain-containing protein [Oscillatoriaceae cyanobacterium M7585_C2015_266]|nr:DUF11 domain-containing protein [Oscillatoriaceae cyanobacterium M7585_C2015_266]